MFTIIIAKNLINSLASDFCYVEGRQGVCINSLFNCAFISFTCKDSD